MTVLAAVQSTAEGFTSAEVAALEAMRTSVSKSLGWPVGLQFGDTDGVQHWAALCADEIPAGSQGRAGILVSIVVGQGVPGHAVVVAADGCRTLSTVVNADELAGGLKVAQAGALRQFRGAARGSATYARAVAH